MKRIISVLLALILAATVCVPVFASEKESEANTLEAAGGYPVIIIRGMDFTGLYIDYGTDNQHNCMGDINIGSILKAVGSAIVSRVFKNDRHEATHKLCVELNEIFGGYACNDDGSSKYNVGTEKFPLAAGNYPELLKREPYEYGITRSVSEAVGGENVYYFNYDWRMNPLDIADEIKETVDRAMKDHGCNKVNIINASMGGVMTVAYLTKYGFDNINRLVFLSSTWCGTYVTSDLLQGAVNVDADNLFAFLSNLNDNFLYKGLMKALKFTGVFKGLSSLAMKFVENNKDQVYDEMLSPIFGNMLSVWALILPEDYNACLEYMFERPGLTEKRADFIAKTAELQEMMKNRDSMIKQAAENGVEVAVAATYNSPVAPVYARSYVNGDQALETPLMSGHATIAPYGKTLDVKESQYVSPDKVCDTSTALYPDSTWLIKNAPHVSGSYGTDYAKFVVWLITADKPDIKSNPDYPAFMMSGKDEHLSTKW